MNGVYFNKQRGWWHARTTVNGKRYHVGYFNTELAGLRAIDDFRYDLAHPESALIKGMKLELEAPKDERRKFEPKKWFTKALSRITRK